METNEFKKQLEQELNDLYKGRTVNPLLDLLIRSYIEQRAFEEQMDVINCIIKTKEPDSEKTDAIIEVDVVFAPSEIICEKIYVDYKIGE
jgi:hypothetical protein